MRFIHNGIIEDIKESSFKINLEDIKGIKIDSVDKFIPGVKGDFDFKLVTFITNKRGYVFRIKSNQKGLKVEDEITIYTQSLIDNDIDSIKLPIHNPLFSIW